MKICLVCPYCLGFPGGVQEHVKALYQQFKKLGHEVKILAPSSRWGEKPDSQDILYVGRSRRLNISGTHAPITFGLNYSLKIRRILKRENFDILHLHDPWVPTLSWFMMYHAKVPLVATFHCTQERIPKKQSLLIEPFIKPLVRSLLKRLAGKIAVSQAAKSWIASRLSGEYQIIPNGVDTQRFHPRVPPLVKFKDRKINILSVGRLEERKGLFYLLQALPQIKKKARLIVVSDGPLRKEFERFVRENKLLVSFEGAVLPEVLPSYYATADIFCSPATHGESFGIVLLEAMASGVPIVASRIAGYSEVVGHRREGILVPPKDAGALSEALNLLIKNKSLRQKLSKAGLLKAKRYDWERVAKKILLFYRKILKEYNTN